MTKVQFERDKRNHDITYKGISINIGAGDADKVSVFKEGNKLYIFSINHGLGYAGLEIWEIVDWYQGNIAKKVNEVFLQNSQDFEGLQEYFGIKKDFFDLSDIQQCKILARYIIETT